MSAFGAEADVFATFGNDANDPSVTWARGRSRIGTLWNVLRRAASLRLDVGGADHLAPLLDFIGDELSELAGRVRHRRYDSEFDEPLPDPAVEKGGIDQLVERRDDVGRRGRGGSEADPAERLVSLEDAVDGRNVR